MLDFLFIEKLSKEIFFVVDGIFLLTKQSVRIEFFICWRIEKKKISKEIFFRGNLIIFLQKF